MVRALPVDGREAGKDVCMLQAQGETGGQVGFWFIQCTAPGAGQGMDRLRHEVCMRYQ